MTGQRLVEAMGRAGLTIPALAAAISVSYETVSSWRQGRRKPCCIHMLAALEDALGLYDA